MNLGKLKVGAHKYKVRLLSGVPDGMTSYAGLVNHTNTSIDITCVDVGSAKSDSRLRQVLMHEVLHAIDATFNAGGKSLTEPQIDALAEGIAQVLTDNPQLRAFYGN